MQDYIPSTSPRVAKSNRTKRERWQRLILNPDAERLMRSIYRLETEWWHARNHVGGYTDCVLPQCEFRDLRVAERAEYSRRLLIDEFTFQFCRQFDATIGYVKRFRNRVMERDANEPHAFDEAERFTEADQQALHNWLTENP